MLFLSCFCYAFVQVSLLMPCGHLLAKDQLTEGIRSFGHQEWFACRRSVRDIAQEFMILAQRHHSRERD